MKRVQVNIINYLNKITNLQELMPKEFAVVGQWKEQGILEHLYVKDDNTGAFLVFKDTDEARVKELISTLPMFKYFDNVVYSSTEMQF
ncbi:hypothetical protein A3860_35330 [Niastella vici]|uniref:Muconolactone isomerase domain-containing protein n=1 Tax=Niastella vici TaxID=1703345 RepID=A0A1V9FNW7_9BACT|nr:muconolactone Delta-isomerase family protein [Niastella vici]OQP60045.1 hypothetical protein A3860_35330 [Niastella vici]